MLTQEQASRIKLLAAKYGERCAVEEARVESDDGSADLFDDLCAYIDTLTKEDEQC